MDISEKEGDMKFVIGLLVGFALGIGAGLLLAPQTGEDTRTQITEQGVMLRDRSAGLTGEIRARATDALTQGRDLYERTKTELMDQYTKTRSAQ